MKKLLILFALLIVGCAMSTEELEQEVLRSITEQLNENSIKNTHDTFYENKCTWLRQACISISL